MIYHNKSIYCSEPKSNFECCLPTPYATTVSRHSEHSEESISKVLLSNKDSSVTSFPQNDVKRAAFTFEKVFSSHPTSQRKCAFTLAEVLITLGIIGIVAAMTMPALIANHQKKVAVNKLKKFYAEIQQAMIGLENDGIFFKDIDAVGYPEFVEKNILPKYSGARYFYSENAYWAYSMCGNKKKFYHWRRSNKQGITSGALPSVPSPSILTGSGACMTFWKKWDVDLIITLDIDSYNNGKNTLGSDVFYFQIDKDKNRIVPYGFDKTEAQILSNCPDKRDISMNSSGDFCTARLINDGWEINYE